MGILYENIYYIELHNYNNLKNSTLEANVYFTLRDIFNNAKYLEYSLEANEYINKLTNNICYEERTPTFQYTEVLKNKEYLESLILWLSQFKLSDFDFTDEIDEDCEVELYLLINEYDYNSKYMKFDSLTKLIILLSIKSNPLKRNRESKFNIFENICYFRKYHFTSNSYLFIWSIV